MSQKVAVVEIEHDVPRIDLLTEDTIDPRVEAAWARASTGTFRGSDGLIKTALADTPRKQFNADGTFDKWLIEQQRTNLLPRSEPNAGVPNGWNVTDGFGMFSHTLVNHLGLNAVKHVQSTSGRSALGINLALATNTDYVLSVWFDRSRTFITAGSNTLVSVLQFGAGSVRNLGISDMDPDGRITTTFNTGDDGTGFIFIGVAATPFNEAVGEAVFTGWQLEQGTQPTSLIITADAPATRAADDVVITGPDLDALGIQNGMMVIAEAISNNPVGGGIVSAQIDGFGDGWAILLDSPNDRFRIVRRNASGAGLQLILNLPTTINSEGNRAAVFMSEGEGAGSADGQPVLSNSTVITSIGPIVELQIGRQAIVGNLADSNLSGGIRFLAIYPNRRLSNAELQAASVVGQRHFTGAGNPAMRFSEHNISGGVQIERASDAVPAVSVARRVSWANTAGDVIDPSLSPADKRELSALWKSKTYSLDASFDGTPSDSTTVRLELVDEASQDIEGHRLARIRQRQRNWYRWTALTGALQVQAGDQVGLAHDGAVVLGPLRDEQGQVIRDSAQQPIVIGKTVMIKALEESFPSGRVFVEAWA